MPDPAVHTLPLPSIPPAAPRSSQSHALRRSLLAHPALPPTLSDNAPAGLPGGSAPHSSRWRPQKLSPPPLVSSPPAPRTARECTVRWETPSACHSTPPIPDAAPPPVISRDCVLQRPAPSPAL